MSNSFGNIFKITTWGESHGNSLGVVIDGCPPGIEISLDFIQKELKVHNIEVQTQTDITEIVTRSKKIAAIKTDQGQDINCELLVVAKGVSANTGLIENTDISKQWGIITDENMRTNHKNVFAAGDVAETYDIVTEEHTINALWTCAVQQGLVAGYNIAEKPKVYNGSLGMNSLNFFNTSLISYGINSPKDESEYKILVDRKHDQNNYKKIIIKPFLAKDLSFVSASLETIRGTVFSKWELNESQLKLNIRIPFNTSADIYIPANKDAKVYEGGKSVSDVDGINLHGYVKNYQVYSVDSGGYEFIVML